MSESSPRDTRQTRSNAGRIDQLNKTESSSIGNSIGRPYHSKWSVQIVDADR